MYPRLDSGIFRRITRVRESNTATKTSNTATTKASNKDAYWVDVLIIGCFFIISSHIFPERGDERPIDQ